MRHHHPRRFAAAGMLFSVLSMVLAAAAPGARAQEWSPPGTVWVEASGHTVDGYFLDEWRAAQSIFGLPITEELKAKVALDGEPARERIVQYFQNLAIAYVPEAKERADQVRLLSLGADALAADKAAISTLKVPTRGTCAGLTSSDCLAFSSTKHSLRWGFKTFWEANDGDRLIGDPLTEEFVGTDGVTVQYFEHVVLTWTKKDGVTVRPVGVETAKRLKLKTKKIVQPDDVPIYDESLFVPPVVESVGGGLGSGPGPQQGGYKEIVISISQQAMWAYEGGALFASSYVSTGTGEVPETVTPIGYYSVWSKYDVQTMEGTISNEHYRVEDVPHVMYFDYAGNAIHGAYWHNNFGTPMSHGCVNLPLDVAAALYSWAPEGTAVTVIA